MTSLDVRGSEFCIRAVNLSKRFGSVQALDGVSITVAPGEIRAVTGENGSGKSTLVGLLSGRHQPDQGYIELDGKRVSLQRAGAALSHGIAVISQELSLASTLTVAENVLLNREPRGRLGLLSWGECRREAQKVLDRLGFALDATARVADLSIEEQQAVEVARALSATRTLLVLDEATSSLSESAATRLLEIVRTVADNGAAVLIISHRMRELYATASSATVLRDGKLVDTVPLPTTSEREIVSLMVGREIGDYFPRREKCIGPIKVSIRNLRTRDGRVNGVNLDVRSGEIVGVAGLVGSGKSELAKVLSGGSRQVAGDLLLDNKSISIGSPSVAMRHGIGYIPDDRRRASILPNRSLVDNVLLAWLNDLPPFALFRSGHLRNKATAALRRSSVSGANARMPIDQLSGGNQQKLIFGRTLARRCDVLVLNEPTRGIDVAAKREIYEALAKYTEKGSSVLLISSELIELLGITDRIYVMYGGVVVAEYETTDANEKIVATAAVTGSGPELSSTTTFACPADIA